jgi:serine/threonine protein kinase
VLAPAHPVPASVARFTRGARAISPVRNPHVVAVYAARQENDVAFLEMEYVYGPTLDDLIRHHSGPVPLRLAIDLVRQMAEGLAALHKLVPSVTHRDLKPTNALLEWVFDDPVYPMGWRLRLADFDLAIAAGSAKLTSAGAIVGTPPYWSPEQIDASLGRVGSPSDVFTLGGMAYQLLTGRHPFEEDGTETSAAKILRCAVPLPRETDPLIPERLEQYVMKMLSRDPTERPPSEKVAAEWADLWKVLSGSEKAGPLNTPLAATPAEGTTPPESPGTELIAESELPHAAPRQRRFAWLMVVVLATNAVAGLVSYRIFQPGNPQPTSGPPARGADEVVVKESTPQPPPVENVPPPRRTDESDRPADRPAASRPHQPGQLDVGDSVVMVAQAIGFEPDGKQSELVPLVDVGKVGTVIQVDKTRERCCLRLDRPSGIEVWVDLTKTRKTNH